jgi:hypothetical protein
MRTEGVGRIDGSYVISRLVLVELEEMKYTMQDHVILVLSYYPHF